MSTLRLLIRDLLYPVMGLVSFAYLATHQHAFLGLIALLLTALYVVKSVRLRRHGAAERRDKETDPQ